MTKNKLENEDEDGEDVKNADNASLPATPPDSTNGDKSANKSMKKSNSLARVLGTSTKKKADDPFRFQEPGIDYKAKLIGVRDVQEARGDQMCQDALMLAKAGAKAANQHKQRILFNISLEGLKIKDEKTGGDLYMFPVAKISFIARDTTDPRAFGFVYGTPDAKHKFYAIKTTQTSDHAVLSIRDMFHIVYEMKKKQMDVAREKQQMDLNAANGGSDQNANTVHSPSHKAPVNSSSGSCAVADLLDLASELETIQNAADQLDTHMASFAPFSVDQNQQAALPQPDASANLFDSPSHQYQYSANTTITQSTGSFSSSGVATTGSSSGHAPPTGPSTTNGHALVADPFGDSFTVQHKQQQVAGNNFGLLAPPSAHKQHAAQENIGGAWPPVSATSPIVNVSHSTPHSIANPFAAPPAANIVPSNDPFETAHITLPPAHNNTAAMGWGEPLMQEATMPMMMPTQLTNGGSSVPRTAASAPMMMSKQAAGLETAPVSSLEDAFSKLVDMKTIVAAGSPSNDPFAHIRRANKPSINLLRGQGDVHIAPAHKTMIAPKVFDEQMTSPTNPFLNQMNSSVPPIPARQAAPAFNNLHHPPTQHHNTNNNNGMFFNQSVTATGADPFANDPFFN